MLWSWRSLCSLFESEKCWWMIYYWISTKNKNVYFFFSTIMIRIFSSGFPTPQLLNLCCVHTQNTWKNVYYGNLFVNNSGSGWWWGNREHGPPCFAKCVNLPWDFSKTNTFVVRVTLCFRPWFHPYFLTLHSRFWVVKICTSGFNFGNLPNMSTMEEWQRHFNSSVCAG